MNTLQINDLMEDIIDGVSKINDNISEIEIEIERTQKNLEELKEQKNNIGFYVIQLLQILEKIQ